MSFPGIETEVLYILVYININIDNDIDKDHYIYDVLDYNIGKWWNYDDATITKYSEFPNNVYNNLSNDLKHIKRKNVVLDGSDRIVSMLYVEK